MKVRRQLAVAGITGLVVLALIGAGVYAYFFSGLHTSPAKLGLSATPTAGGSPTAASTGLVGKWTLTSGSQAGYRVKELFVGQTSKHDAVARTSTVSGGLTISGDETGYQVSAISLTVGLSALHSVDQVAGRDVNQRDSFVARQINVQQFPNATFTASSGAVPGTVTSQPTDVTVAGALTIHGVTKDVSATAKAQVLGDQIEVAGSISIDMTDFGVSPPRVPFTTVDSQVVLEFDILLVKAQ